MNFNPIFFQPLNSAQGMDEIGKLQKLSGNSYLFSDIIKVCIDKSDAHITELKSNNGAAISGSSVSVSKKLNTKSISTSFYTSSSDNDKSVYKLDFAKIANFLGMASDINTSTATNVSSANTSSEKETSVTSDLTQDELYYFLSQLIAGLNGQGINLNSQTIKFTEDNNSAAVLTDQISAVYNSADNAIEISFPASNKIGGNYSYADLINSFNVSNQGSITSLLSGSNSADTSSNENAKTILMRALENNIPIKITIPQSTGEVINLEIKKAETAGSNNVFPFETAISSDVIVTAPDNTTVQTNLSTVKSNKKLTDGAAVAKEINTANNTAQAKSETTAKAKKVFPEVETSSNKTALQLNNINEASVENKPENQITADAVKNKAAIENGNASKTSEENITVKITDTVITGQDEITAQSTASADTETIQSKTVDPSIITFKTPESAAVTAPQAKHDAISADNSDQEKQKPETGKNVSASNQNMYSVNIQVKKDSSTASANTETKIIPDDTTANNSISNITDALAVFNYPTEKSALISGNFVSESSLKRIINSSMKDVNNNAQKLSDTVVDKNGIVKNADVQSAKNIKTDAAASSSGETETTSARQSSVPADSENKTVSSSLADKQNTAKVQSKAAGILTKDETAYLNKAEIISVKTEPSNTAGKNIRQNEAKADKETQTVIPAAENIKTENVKAKVNITTEEKSLPASDTAKTESSATENDQAKEIKSNPVKTESSVTEKTVNVSSLENKKTVNKTVESVVPEPLKDDIPTEVKLPADADSKKDIKEMSGNMPSADKIIDKNKVGLTDNKKSGVLAGNNAGSNKEVVKQETTAFQVAGEPVFADDKKQAEIKNTEPEPAKTIDVKTPEVNTKEAAMLNVDVKEIATPEVNSTGTKKVETKEPEVKSDEVKPTEVKTKDDAAYTEVEFDTKGETTIKINSSEKKISGYTVKQSNLPNLQTAKPENENIDNVDILQNKPDENQPAVIKSKEAPVKNFKSENTKEQQLDVNRKENKDENIISSVNEKNIANNELKFTEVRNSKTDNINDKTVKQDINNAAEKKIKTDNKEVTAQGVTESKEETNTSENDLTNKKDEKQSKENAENISSFTKNNSIRTNENDQTFSSAMKHAEANAGVKEKAGVEVRHYTDTEYKTVKAPEVMKEITNFISKGETKSIVLKIDPENLGKVKVVLDMTDKVVNARIEVENENVKQAVINNIDNLKNTLAQNGVQLNSVNVNLPGYEQKNSKQMQPKKKQDANFSDDEIEEAKNANNKSWGYNTYEYVI